MTDEESGNANSGSLLQSPFVVKFGGIVVFAGLAWLLPWVFAGAVNSYVSPMVLLMGGIYLGFLENSSLPFRHADLCKKAIGLAMIGFSLWMSMPGDYESKIAWQPYSEEKLATAKQAGKPVMIDFYADWCGPCHLMDRIVFSDEDVGVAAEDFVALRADLTDSNSPEAIRIGEKFSITAFPTVVLIGSDGEERRRLRVVGVERAKPFAKRLQAVE